MAKKLEVTVAESYVDGDDQVFICEFWLEPNGVQRPTFRYPKGTKLEDVAKEMRAACQEQVALNTRGRRPTQNKKHVGKAI